MISLLDIITITKDDLIGLAKTIKSTQEIRSAFNFRQLIIDSSNHENQNLIKKLITNEVNIYYFWQSPEGIAGAFNYGISLSNSKWVWFLNGGDELSSSLNLNFFKLLLNENNADAVVFQLRFDSSQKVYSHPTLWRLWPPINNWIFHPAVVINNRLFKKFGNYSEKFKIAMDYEFWIRCFSRDVRVDLISIVLATFNEGGISSNIKSKKILYRETLFSLLLHSGKLMKVMLSNLYYYGITLLTIMKRSFF